MKFTKEDIKNALREVKDPDINKDLVSLNMIRNIAIKDESSISFDVVLTTPACPLKERIKADCLDAIKRNIGVDIDIHIEMKSEVTSHSSNQSMLKNVKNTIAITSGKGGVGKSTISANLAVSLAQSGAKVGLIDADIFGPSIPTMFNCEFEKPTFTKGKDGKNKIVPITQYGVKILSIGFLTKKNDAMIWRGPMASSVIKQFILDTDWGSLDYLLFDLPPGTGDIHLTLVQSLPVTGAIIVTTPQKVALDDAQKAISMFKQPQINVPILGIVENMAFFIPRELPENKYFLFGKDGGNRLAESNDSILLGQIPIVQSIRESGDIGYPITLKKEEIVCKEFQNLAKTVAQQISIRNAALSKTKKVEITH